MKYTLIAVALAVLAAGCSTTTTKASTPVEDMDATIATAKADLDLRTRAAENFQVVDEMWLGATAVKRPDPADVRPELEQQVRLQKSWGLTLHQVAEAITEATGIQATVTEDAVEASGAIKRAIPNLPASVALPNLPSLPGGAAPATTGGAGNLNDQGAGIVLNYSGPLRGLLDNVSARTNTGWRYEHGRIEFFHVDTRVFNIDILPGAMSLAGNITNQSSGGQQGGGGSTEGSSTQMQGGTQTSLSVEVDQFGAVQETIKGMVTARGKVTASPALGQVVVTDVPAALSRIGRYVDEVNRIATRQVVMDVKVFAVEKADTNGYAISWDLVWKSVSKQIGVEMVGGSAMDEGTNVAASVLSGSSPFAGTKVFLDALATQGKLKQLTSVAAVTLSGRPVPVQVAEEVSYQESSQVSLVPDVGQQITRTQGKVTSGFSMVLLPILTERKDVLLQAQINLSSLRELRRLGSVEDGSYTEMPLIDSRQVMQNVRLDSGQTLVLTGFEQETLRSDANGVGSARFTLLGGGKKSQKNNSTLVILITPRITS